MPESVKEQFDRLNAESLIPMALDDGTEIIVGAMAGGAASIGVFPQFIDLTIRQNGKEATGRYILSISHGFRVSSDDSNLEEKILPIIDKNYYR